jgi:phospholipid/cholesterol/gamma-HCH transport system substrate-binding protein
MNKEAPSVGRILVMVAFALSCISLLLWLWISFGGPLPLKPEGYQLNTHLPEQPLLTKAADIRMSGLDVGNITTLEFDRRRGQRVEMQIDPEFAPIPKDSRIIARQKSLLGQVYIEITPGTRDGPMFTDGDTIPSKQQVGSTELDEIIQLFNEETRENFRGWIREIAIAIDNGRGEDLSNAIGNLDDFAAAGSDVLKILDDQDPALRRLVRNTGTTLNALTERRGQLRELIGNANGFFEALARRNDALAETISIFPTFLDESRLTLNRLRVFAADTHPLVKDLIPVAFQLRPTLRDLGSLAPDLKDVFRKLDPIITESKENLPAAERFLEGAEPLFPALHTYLPEFNPFLSFLNYQQETVSNFIHSAAGSLNATMPPLSPNEGPRHYLRQFSISNARGVTLQSEQRQTWERASAYPLPNYLKRFRPLGMTEAFDCTNTNPALRSSPNGTQADSANGEPPCFVQPPHLWDGKMFPRLERGNKIVSKPIGNRGTAAPQVR